MKIYVHRRTCTQISRAALCLIAQKWKTTQTSINRRMSKMLNINTTEYYSTIRRNEVLIHATILLNLENIMLSTKIQTEKTIYCIIPLMYNVHNRQILRDRKKISGQAMLVTVHGHGVPFSGD